MPTVQQPTPTQKAAPADFTRRYAMLAFRIMGEFGAVIAVPVVLLAVLGKRLDAAYGTAPYLRIAGFAIAALITAAMINRRARDYGREYEALGKEEAAARAKNEPRQTPNSKR